MGSFPPRIITLPVSPAQQPFATKHALFKSIHTYIIYHGEECMPYTYFVWVLVPPLLGVFWYQLLQLGAEMNELFVQVDAKKERKN